MTFDPKTYWNERLRQHYNLQGVGDISQTHHYNKWSYKVTWHVLSRLIRQYVPRQAGSVLDIGSGTGFIIGIWKQFDKQVNGIDISSEAVMQLKKNFPGVQFYEIDAGNQPLPFADNSLQAVTAASVLYHVVDDAALERLLQSVHAKLVPSGVFIFSDNFIHHADYDLEHQRCRTLVNYETLLRKNGFEIVSRVPNFVLFNDPVDTTGRLLPAFWGKLTFYTKKWNWLDAAVWPLLYPLELLLARVMTESPAQEFMICKAIK